MIFTSENLCPRFELLFLLPLSKIWVIHSGKFIFAQFIEFLHQKYFQKLVMKYEGDKYVKHFSCWNQLLVIMFGQLSNRNSFRDLTSTISAHFNKAYHFSFSKSITKSNLTKANERRDPKIFENFAYYINRYCSQQKR